jgi:hypothetical protein
VLRTNARISPLQAVLRYRDLLQVEDLFRLAKTMLRTRSIYHSADAAIRGQRLLLLPDLQKDLADRCRAAGITFEWPDLLRDRPSPGGHHRQRWQAHHRTAITGQVGAVLQAVGVALPPKSANTRPDSLALKL